MVCRPELITTAWGEGTEVEHGVIVEVKSLDRLAAVHRKQLLTYLRLTELRVGLLLNFGAETMKDGIRRVVNDR